MKGQLEAVRTVKRLGCDASDTEQQLRGGAGCQGAAQVAGGAVRVARGSTDGRCRWRGGSARGRGGHHAVPEVRRRVACAEEPKTVGGGGGSLRHAGEGEGRKKIK